MRPPFILPKFPVRPLPQHLPRTLALPQLLAPPAGSLWVPGTLPLGPLTSSTHFPLYPQPLHQERLFKGLCQERGSCHPFTIAQGALLLSDHSWPPREHCCILSDFSPLIFPPSDTMFTYLMCLFVSVSLPPKEMAPQKEHAHLFLFTPLFLVQSSIWPMAGTL